MSPRRQYEGDKDPWLCGPGFRRVCLCRGMVRLSYVPVRELSSGLRRQPGAVNYSAGRPGRAYACAGPICDTGGQVVGIGSAENALGQS
jgi:hypothetical protein